MNVSSASDVTELTQVLQRLLRLKHRIRAVLPADVVRIREQMDALPEDRADRFADHDLLFRLGAILAEAQEPLTMGELSRELDVPQSSATRIVDWLVVNGYVERLPDSSDRRVVRVSFSETGLAMYHIMYSFMRGRVERWLGRFAPEERQYLVSALAKLADVLEEEIAPSES